jgi:hypothetical protein
MIARGLLVLALALVPAAASPQASGKGPLVLRGPEKPAPPAPARTANADQAPAAPPSDIATGLMASPATPLIAPTAPNFGGSECRRACARDLYQCRVDRDEIDCNPAWMRCVIACPEVSSSLP